MIPIPTFILGGIAWNLEMANLIVSLARGSSILVRLTTETKLKLKPKLKPKPKTMIEGNKGNSCRNRR